MQIVYKKVNKYSIKKYSRSLNEINWLSLILCKLSTTITEYMQVYNTPIKHILDGDMKKYLKYGKR